MTEAFGNRHGVFVHVDPLDEHLDEADDLKKIDSLLYKLENLSRCVTRSEQLYQHLLEAFLYKIVN